MREAGTKALACCKCCWEHSHASPWALGFSPQFMQIRCEMSPGQGGACFILTRARGIEGEGEDGSPQEGNRESGFPGFLFARQFPCHTSAWFSQASRTSELGNYHFTSEEIWGLGTALQQYQEELQSRIAPLMKFSKGPD